MKSYVPRLLIFFVGLPCIVAITLFLGFGNGLGISVLVCLFSGLGGLEVVALNGTAPGPLSRFMGFSFAFLPPLCAYFIGLGRIPEESFGLLITILSLIVLSLEVFSRPADIPGIFDRVRTRLFPIIYPGVLASYIVRIGSLDGSRYLFLLFFAMTFGNDSLAWACGMTLGRRRNIVPVSPNKSLAGFIGGFLSSLCAGSLAHVAFPGIFPASILTYAICGALVGLAVILGDLAESGLKRQAGKKDSGTIIPGRGGVLDSIDSLIFAAPIFYGVLRFFGQ